MKKCLVYGYHRFCCLQRVTMSTIMIQRSRSVVISVESESGNIGGAVIEVSGSGFGRCEYQPCLAIRI